MEDISDEIQEFMNAKTGPSFKEKLITLLIKLNGNVEDASSITFDDFYNGCFYRGKSLGSGATFEQASTAEQRAAIADGTFEDMYIGDYWTIAGKVFRIADFNYFYNVGDTDFTTNHVVIVPDNGLLNAKMNETNIVTGGYTGSEFYASAEGGLAQAKSIINSLFGTYVATHRIYLSNTTADGADSAGAWFDSTVDLMNEIMVYGTYIRKRTSHGSHIAVSEKNQLALFRLNPALINRRINYWLRDVVSSTYFAYVYSRGSASSYGASSSFSVRPFFVIKGTK